MMTSLKNTFILLFILIFLGCNHKEAPLTIDKEPSKKIEMTTNYGTMIIKLYDETPLHRDNFINLTKNKAFDSLLFHRIINEFMIQGGDPDSKRAKPEDTLGEGDAPYLVKAEFNKELFHKKGVLAAARDDHPERSSSAMQFYIVQGKVYNDSLLDKAESYSNKNFAMDHFKKNAKHKSLLDSIQNARDQRNFDRYKLLRDSVLNLAKTDNSFSVYTIPENQREVYKSIGGTPHLDQNYTVFGEVVNGIEVIDSVAGVNTDPLDRPLKDVRILSVRLME